MSVFIVMLWQKSDDNVTRDWETALDYCQKLELAGINNWRLPNVKELLSIINYSHYGPATDPTYFPGNQNNYWTSTTEAHNAENAWIVNFFYGDSVAHIGAKQGMSANYYVRCVQ